MKAYCRDVWVFFHVFSLSKLRLLSFQTHKRAWSWIFLRHEHTFVVIIFPLWLSSEIPRLQEHLWLFRGVTWSAAAVFHLCTERRVFDSKSRQCRSKIQHSRAQSSCYRDNNSREWTHTQHLMRCRKQSCCTSLDFTIQIYIQVPWWKHLYWNI